MKNAEWITRPKDKWRAASFSNVIYLLDARRSSRHFFLFTLINEIFIVFCVHLFVWQNTMKLFIFRFVCFVFFSCIQWTVVVCAIAFSHCGTPFTFQMHMQKFLHKSMKYGKCKSNERGAREHTRARAHSLNSNYRDVFGACIIIIGFLLAAVVVVVVATADVRLKRFAARETEMCQLQALYSCSFMGQWIVKHIAYF